MFATSLTDTYVLCYHAVVHQMNENSMFEMMRNGRHGSLTTTHKSGLRALGGPLRPLDRDPIETLTL